MMIGLHAWGPRGRPCDFALCLLDGAVFADFDIKRPDTISLARISFDGYGCCETKNVRPMATEDGRKLLAAVESGHLDTAEVAAVLRRYFSQIDGTIWRDALKHYGLLVEKR